VVRQVVNRSFFCGLLENGFARVRCPRCKPEHFCAFRRLVLDELVQANRLSLLFREKLLG